MTHNAPQYFVSIEGVQRARDLMGETGEKPRIDPYKKVDPKIREEVDELFSWSENWDTDKQEFGFTGEMMYVGIL